jgi:hypothetical protein
LIELHFVPRQPAAELQDIELAATSQRVADGPAPFGERDLWNIRAAEFR